MDVSVIVKAVVPTVRTVQIVTVNTVSNLTVQNNKMEILIFLFVVLIVVVWLKSINKF